MRASGAASLNDTPSSLMNSDSPSELAKPISASPSTAAAKAVEPSDPIKPQGAKPVSRWRFWLLLALSLPALLLSAWSIQQARNDAQELVRRLQVQDGKLLESQTQSKLLQDALRDSQAKISVMESRVNEAASQQAQLEKLYRALSNDSMDVALADLEGVILVAAQQAASGGSLQGPLIGLQAAEAKLERLADPSLGNLKRALAKDVERIKLIAQQDSGGLAQKIEAISAQIDSFPLLSEPKKVERGAPTEPASTKPADAKKPDPKATGARQIQSKADAPGKAEVPAKASSEVSQDAAAIPSSQGFWARLLDLSIGKGKVVGQDWRDLIRVTRVENPDAALLSPEQAYFVRENLRLRLLNARMALSSRQETVLKADLERARVSLSTYFDSRDRQVLAAQEQIKTILAARGGNEPTLNFDSLAVVRNLRSLREVKK
jgi:uroporphyrin-III C-methyltransferase